MSKPKSWKQKGRAAEHAVIGKLQEWWRAVEPTAVFFRTPRSGGWSNAAATGMKTMGDLCYDPSTCKLWPFSVEVKHQKVVTLAGVEKFAAGEPIVYLDEFWEQCMNAAEKDGLEPLLAFRGDKMDFRVAYMSHGKRTVNLLESFLFRDPKQFLKKK